MEVDTICTDITHTNRLSDEERQRLLKEGRCFNCKKLGHMMRTCPNKQQSNSNNSGRQGGQTTTPSRPAQGTARMRTAIINEDEEDAKEEKGKEKEDMPLAYKPESLIEHIKRLNTTDREDLLEQLVLEADF
jgi:Zinc knuckle